MAIFLAIRKNGKDGILEDLNKKLKIAPQLSFLLGWKIFQAFTIRARGEVLDNSSENTLGKVSGLAFKKSFRGRIKKNKSYVVTRISSRLGNLWEGKSDRKRIPFFSRMVSYFKRNRFGQKVVEGVLQDFDKNKIKGFR